jgi:hypothetical protein
MRIRSMQRRDSLWPLTVACSGLAALHGEEPTADAEHLALDASWLEVGLGLRA